MKSSSLQFQIEKRTRNVFQLHEVYKACCFKSHWKRIRWQKPIKKLVFLLPQRKIRCATTSLFGVGGSGRRPLEFEECWGSSGTSLHRSEGFSHLGAPGGLEGLPGDPIGLHETIGTLWGALEVALRCPGSKIRLSSALPRA